MKGQNLDRVHYRITYLLPETGNPDWDSKRQIAFATERHLAAMVLHIMRDFSGRDLVVRPLTEVQRASVEARMQAELAALPNRHDLEKKRAQRRQVDPRTAEHWATEFADRQVERVRKQHRGLHLADGA